MFNTYLSKYQLVHNVIIFYNLTVNRLKLLLPLLKGRIHKFGKSIYNTSVSFLHDYNELIHV